MVTKMEKTPGETSEYLSERTCCIVGYGFAAAFILFLWILRLSNPPFSPDSWSYYEISKSIFSDFGKINTLRHYQQNLTLGYNASFPPLWPTLIAIFDSLLNSGIYSGYILNLFIFVFTLYMNARIAKDLIGSALAGVFLSLVLLSYKHYVGELLSAGSIPLAFLFQQIVVYILLKNKTLLLNHVLLLALLSGLCALTRFDFLLSALVLPVVIASKNRHWSLKENSIYLVMLLLILSPWMIYSLNVFHKIWITDNSRTVLLAMKSSVADYFPEGKTLPNLFTHPIRWLQVFFSIRLVEQLKVFTSTSLLRPVMVLFVFFLLQHTKLTDRKSFFVDWCKVGLIWLVLLFAISLSGYSEKRYYTAFFWYFSLLLLAASGIGISKSRWKIFFLLIMMGIVTMNNTQRFIEKNKEKIVVNLNQNHLTSQSFEPILEIVPGSASILFWGVGDEFKFGALTGIKTLFVPENIKDNPGLIQKFIQDYPVDYVYTRSNMIDELKPFRKKATLIIENEDASLTVVHP
jgi:hypothetical protein